MRSALSLLENPQPHGGGGQDEVGARRTRRLRAPGQLEEEDEEGARRSPSFLKNPRPQRLMKKFSMRPTSTKVSVILTKMS